MTSCFNPSTNKSEVGVYISQGDGFEREIKVNSETLGKMGSVEWNQEQTLNADLWLKPHNAVHVIPSDT